MYAFYPEIVAKKLLKKVSGNVRKFNQIFLEIRV